MLWLRNELLEAAFDANSGAFVYFSNPRTKWEIISRTDLGLGFEMLIPLPDRLNHRTLASNQKLTDCRQDRDGQRVTLIWDNPLCQSGVPIDAKFTAMVTLTDLGLQFDGELVNRSNLVIDNVAWPLLGELAAPNGLLERFTAG